MQSDVLALVQDLDRRRGQTRLDLVVHESVWDRVEVAVDEEVVVDVDATLRPVRVLEADGGQRTQRRALQLLEELAPALAVAAHLARVQVHEQLADAHVHRARRVEDFVAHSSDDPSLRDLYTDLDLGLVAWSPWARRQHRRAVVPRELLVRALRLRLVPARPCDPRLQLVGHQGGGNAVEKFQRAHVTRDEVRPTLRPRHLGVRQIRGAKHRDEELELDHLPSRRIHDVRLLPGVVDEKLVAGDVDLAHHEAAPLQPLAIPLAERRVLQPVGDALDVLVVKQLQRHADAMALTMDPRAIGAGPLRRRDHGGVQPAFELGVVDGLDSLPVQARVSRAPRRKTDDPRTDAQRLGDRTMRPAKQPLLAENFPRISHR